jgi:hypothetical protein
MISARATASLKIALKRCSVLLCLLFLVISCTILVRGYAPRGVYAPEKVCMYCGARIVSNSNSRQPGAVECGQMIRLLIYEWMPKPVLPK